ncbi:MAG TPA: GGDEF domain-containing protein [Polaromonas sp.]|uniref:GGDEF domain-containing protein n=1 Tax=Polaromonas sp. TaxID=1869339 RepID=UPI002D2DEE26|nr:GGDEF domain-containing protein [Polaromonas sp.]HYW57243.1 GGDEF domain-containing protein [Polaromonas sp.]
MDKLAYGFWGFYFGLTALILAGAAVTFARSLHRISLNAALSATASAFFAFAFLGGLPISDEDTLARFLAHVALVVSAVLAYLLFIIVGTVARPGMRDRVLLALAGMVLAGVAVGWQLSARHALVLSMATACALGVIALVVAVRHVLRGDRLAWTAAAGVFFVLIAIAGMGWIALDRTHVPWQVHAISAMAGSAYVVTMASALWIRYAYLNELHQVMVHGPGYDPVTRMRSHTETGHMLGDAFKRYRSEPTSMGVIVLSIGNLYALEKLHGMAAVNHALFVCAGRLRRTAPLRYEIGRLSTDGFVMLLRNCNDSGQLIQLAHRVVAHLSKSVVLNTNLDAARRENEQTRWEADIGIGVLLVSDPAAKASMTLATCRAMSRTAMTYASRVAWFDQHSGEAVEMPVFKPS